MPFEGACDARIRLTDQIVDERKMLLVLATIRNTMAWYDRRIADFAAYRRVIAGEREALAGAGIHVYTMRDIDELGMATVARRALSHLNHLPRIHVSLDMDSIDPDVAPGVGTPTSASPTRSLPAPRGVRGTASDGPGRRCGGGESASGASRRTSRRRRRPGLR
jgi:hypothetical protein